MIVAGVVIETVPGAAPRVAARLLHEPGLELQGGDGDRRLAAVFTGPAGGALEALAERLVHAFPTRSRVFPTYVADDDPRARPAGGDPLIPRDPAARCVTRSPGAVARRPASLGFPARAAHPSLLAVAASARRRRAAPARLVAGGDTHLGGLMSMKARIMLAAALAVLAGPAAAQKKPAAAAGKPAATKPAAAKPAAKPGGAGGACVTCHAKVNPNIVKDWELSRHSQVEVDCTACHGAAHKSKDDFAKATMPTPDTCAQCHDAQVAQFKKGKHAFAWAAVKAMPTFHYQPVAIREGLKGCGGCHKLGPQDGRGAGGAPQGRGAVRERLLRRLPHPPPLLEGGGPPARGLPDLSHGLRSPAVGDVLRLQARRQERAQADGRDPGALGRPDLPDVPHAGGQPRGPHGLGLPRRPAAVPRERPAVEGGPHHASCRGSACSIRRATPPAGSRW